MSLFTQYPHKPCTNCSHQALFSDFRVYFTKLKHRLFRITQHRPCQYSLKASKLSQKQALTVALTTSQDVVNLYVFHLSQNAYKFPFTDGLDSSTTVSDVGDFRRTAQAVQAHAHTSELAIPIHLLLQPMVTRNFRKLCRFLRRLLREAVVMRLPVR